MGSWLDRHYRAFGSWRASLGTNPATMQHEYLYLTDLFERRKWTIL